MKSTLFAALLSVVMVGAAVTAAAGPETVLLCHKPDKKKAGITMQVLQPAAAAHFGHGDTAGACPTSPSR
jgi:hypothetical protein